MEMDNSKYCDWFLHASEYELKLVDKVRDFGELFEDMLFEPGTYSYDLIRCEYQPVEDGEWIAGKIPLPIELKGFSYSYFQYKVEELENREGYYDHLDQSLCIAKNKVDNDPTILHDMIHLHEYVINDLPLFYHDMLYWALYQNLRTRIEGLDSVITDHAHLLNGSLIYEKGGLHDILFLLKSLDLDIRKRYPLGTVFGYNFTDKLKDLKCIS